MSDEKLLTLEEAAKILRRYAQMTANYSQNWDNFEQIALDMLKARHEARR